MLWVSFDELLGIRKDKAYEDCYSISGEFGRSGVEPLRRLLWLLK